MSTTPCRIGLLGFGTVGSALARRLTAENPVHNVELTHVFDRRAEQKRAANLSNSSNPSKVDRIVWTGSIDDVLTSDVDVIVEAIGGVEPAAGWIRSALLAGKSVVTSNKQVIAYEGPSLRALASRQGRQLRFEAAVGGAMPIVRAVAGAMAGDRLRRIVAILNGTTNAVLSRVEALGCSVDAALADARTHGWAEADASLDIDGLDARAKLVILCALGFGLRVDPNEIEARSAARVGPDDFERARRRGGTIRQLACAEYDEASGILTAWVGPAFVAHGTLFARTKGPQNAAILTGEFAGDIQLAGTGAGGDATAVAILGDVLAIARDRAAIVPAPDLKRPVRICSEAPPASSIDAGTAGPHIDVNDCELYTEAV
jgi:homoserine dehydrogenase